MHTVLVVRDICLRSMLAQIALSEFSISGHQTLVPCMPGADLWLCNRMEASSTGVYKALITRYVETRRV